MSKFTSFFKDVSFIAIVNLIVKVRSIILLPLLIHYLSLHSYGVYLQLTITLTFADLFSLLGIPYALVRFIGVKDDLKYRQSVYYTQLFLVIVSSLTTFIILYLISPWLSYYTLRTHKYSYLFRLVSIMTIFYSLNEFNKVFFRGILKIKLFSILDLITKLVEFLITALFSIIFKSLFLIFLGLTIAHLLMVVLSYLLIYKEIKFGFPELRLVKEYLRFSLPMVPSQISGTILTRIDRYIIGYFWGATYVGTYGIINTVANVLDLFIFPLIKTLDAYIPKYWDEKKDSEITSLLSSAFKGYLFFSIPTVFGISYLFPQLFILLSKGENQQFIPIVSYLFIGMSLSLIFASMFRFCEQIIRAEKKTEVIFILQFLGAFSNVVLNIILIPSLSLTGAILSTVIIQISIFISSYLYINRKYQIEFLIKNLGFVLKIIIISTITCIMLHFVSKPKLIHNPIYYIAVYVVIFAIIYLGLAGIIFESNIKRVIRRII